MFEVLNQRVEQSRQQLRNEVVSETPFVVPEEEIERRIRSRLDAKTIILGGIYSFFNKRRIDEES